MRTEKTELTIGGLKKSLNFFKDSNILKSKNIKNRLILKICGLMLGMLFTGQYLAAENGKTLKLTESGKSDYTIVQNANPTAAEKYAVKELSYFLEKVTGVKFLIKNESDIKELQKGIYVGWTDYAKKIMDLSSLGEEEWIIKTVDENLILTGSRPQGTLYAVYEFLEKEIGCHWLDEQNEVIPAKSNLAIGSLDIRECPIFSGREVVIWPMNLCLNQDNFRNFNLRNKMSLDFAGGSRYGSPRGCHTYYDYLKEWQDKHPEYLAMNEKGERVRSVNTAGPGQICPTHPEGRKVILEQLRKFIIEDRKKAAEKGVRSPRIYAIESNDNPLICQCPECKKLVKQEGANSGADLSLANFLAEGVKDEFPDVSVDIFAYATTLHPPKKMHAQDNVIIRFALIDDHASRPLDGVIGNRSADRPDFFRPLTHPVNSLPCEMLMVWTNRAKKINIWDYWRQYFDSKVTPYVILDTIKADLELYQELGIKDIFAEFEPGVKVNAVSFAEISFWPLTRWVGTKLLQNPNQPLEPLIKTFMNGYYGPAAEKMYEYMVYMQKRINECPETMKISRLKPEDRPYLNLVFFVTCERLLDEAEALCVNDKKSLLNVRKERIPLDLSLIVLWSNLKSKLPKDKTIPFDSDAIIKRCEAMRLEQVEKFYLPKMQAQAQDYIKEDMAKQKFMISNPEIPNLLIPRIPEGNGNLSNIDWSKALPVKWYSLGGPEVPDRKVKGALAHDDKYLYVSLEEKIDKGAFANNEWSGDDWELFFAEQRNSSSKQIGIFPDGKMKCYEYIQHGDGGAVQQLWKNNAILLKSTNENGTWQVKMAIPLTSLAPNGLTFGKNYFMNIYRSTPNGKSLCISPILASGNYKDLTRAAVIKLNK